MSTDVKDLAERLRARAFRLAARDLNGDGASLAKEAATALEAQAEEIARLADENDELRRAPWPEWVMKVLAVIRARSGYDGYDDAIDGVDLPAELEEVMAELEREAELHKGAAEHYRKMCAEHRASAEAAERERDALKSENDRLREAALRYFKLRADWDHMVRYGRDPGEDAEATLDAARSELDAALHPTQGGE